MPGTRRPLAGKFALELDGVVCGFLESASGGAIAADVVSVAGADGFDTKHLGRVGYEELELQLDFSLDGAVYDWIAASWKGASPRRDGSIVATDFDGKAVSEQEFFRGLLTGVTVPALDGSSKDAAYLTVKIAPEYVRLAKGSGKTVKSTAGRQLEWKASSFKLEIDGLDTTRVIAIEPFTVTQEVVAESAGDTRTFAELPGRPTFPNLRVHVAASGADTWTAWFDDFVMKGNNDPSHERSGKLTFLDTSLKKTLGEVSFANLGIFRLEPGPGVANVEAIAYVLVDLYCDRMELAVP
jgi:T4-like virus tail tube protein gp19